jgi:hypothetical protein
MQCATHAGILTSLTSTRPSGRASLASGTLSYPSYLYVSHHRSSLLSVRCVHTIQTSPKAALNRVLSQTECGSGSEDR